MMHRSTESWKAHSDNPRAGTLGKARLLIRMNTTCLRHTHSVTHSVTHGVIRCRESCVSSTSQ